MASWTCRYCTLINPLDLHLCGACGSENPNSIKNRKNLVPKIIKKPLSVLAGAVTDIFSVDVKSRPPRPPFPQNIVVVSPSNSSQQISRPDIPPINNSRNSSTSQITSLENNSAQWSCMKCRYLNLKNSIVCQVCKTPAGGEYIVDDPSSNETPIVTSQLSSLCSEITSIVEQDDRARAAETYHRIVKHCGSTSSIFVDDAFPHTNRSLGNLHNRQQTGIVGTLPTEFIWLRPSEIFTKDGNKFNWQIFNDPRSSDIEQGTLGDCWLLSAMALIAERPDILEGILLSKVYNTYGVYQIRICVDGRWNIVTVDDFFPCRASRRTLAFAVGRKNQLWVPLIEKAIAKRQGSYAKLIGGRTIEGLSILTGLPCQTLSLKIEEPEDEQYLWARLLSAKEAGFILGCSCGSRDGPVNHEMYRAKGLMPQHAYSILDLCVEKQYKIIRLRNPWGSFVWNGSWSDNWPLWDKESKARLLKEHITGSFWMSFSDFLAHFDTVDIAKIRYEKPWADSRIPLQIGGANDPSDRCVRFIVEQSTEMCFSLYHTDSRQTEDRIDLLICVHETTRDGKIGMLICRSPRKLESFVCTEDFFFAPGEYVIICHSMSHLGDAKQPGCLAIHSSVNIFGDLIPCRPAMYRDSLIQLMIKDGKESYLHQKLIVRSITSGMGGLILMIDNMFDDSYVHVSTDCSSSNNVVSSRGCMTMADSIPPTSRQIIVVLTQLEHTSSYLIGHRIPPVRLSTFPQLGELALDGNSMESMHSPLLDNETAENLHTATFISN